MLCCKLRKQDILPILKLTYPDYKGRKYFLRVEESVLLYNLNWSDGSRRQYRFVNVDGRVDSLNMGYQQPWANQYEGLRVTLPQDVCCVTRSVICGRETGVTVIIAPETIDRLPPQVKLALISK